mmetsp:Transcript_47144/g.117596  ORF Transcript_47144/g.117596 Transcript_47144/m.117596 type:complete len:183 (-) Transcript_47144:625-1173(-)
MHQSRSVEGSIGCTMSTSKEASKHDRQMKDEDTEARQMGGATASSEKRLPSSHPQMPAAASLYTDASTHPIALLSLSTIRHFSVLFPLTLGHPRRADVAVKAGGTDRRALRPAAVGGGQLCAARRLSLPPMPVDPTHETCADLPGDVGDVRDNGGGLREGGQLLAVGGLVVFWLSTAPGGRP